LTTVVREGRIVLGQFLEVLSGIEIVLPRLREHLSGFRDPLPVLGETLSSFKSVDFEFGIVVPELGEHRRVFREHLPRFKNVLPVLGKMLRRLRKALSQHGKVLSLPGMVGRRFSRDRSRLRTGGGKLPSPPSFYLQPQSTGSRARLRFV
jgi:hypothetical protein